MPHKKDENVESVMLNYYPKVNAKFVNEEYLKEVVFKNNLKEYEILKKLNFRNKEIYYI